MLNKEGKFSLSAMMGMLQVNLYKAKVLEDTSVVSGEAGTAATDTKGLPVNRPACSTLLVIGI